MTTNNRDVSGLLKHAKGKNKKTRLHVDKTLKLMIKEQQIISFSSVAKHAEVSRSWLYNNPVFRQQIEAIRLKQSQKTEFDMTNGNSNSQVKRLQVLKDRIQTLQKENLELREKLEVVYGKLIEKATDQR